MAQAAKRCLQAKVDKETVADMVEDDVQLDTVAINVQADAVSEEGEQDCNETEDEDAEGMDEQKSEEGMGEDMDASGGENRQRSSGKLSGRTTRAATRQVMSIKTTNAADDYAHRGKLLKDFHFLGYEMYVRRVPLNDCQGQVFPFECHYPLASRYGQQIRNQAAIPRLCNFNCPSLESNAEDNGMMKGLLFVPVSCPGEGMCHDVCRFNPLLGLEACHLGKLKGRALFEMSWRVHNCKLQQAAEEADDLESAAGKLLVLKDTTLFRGWDPEEVQQCSRRAVAMRQCLKDGLRELGLPEEAIQGVISYLCLQRVLDDQHVCGSNCESLHWGHHDHQCSVKQFMFRLARSASLNLDLAAESKCLKKPTTVQDEDTDSDCDVLVRREKHAAKEIQEVGGVGEDCIVEDDLGDSIFETQSLCPFTDTSAVVKFALRQEEVMAALEAKHSSRHQVTLKQYYAVYGDRMFDKNELAGAREGNLVWQEHVGLHKADGFALAIEQQRQRFKDFVRQQDEAAGKNESNVKENVFGITFFLYFVLSVAIACEVAVNVADASLAAMRKGDEPSEVTEIPIPLRLQGPGAVGWHLCQAANLNDEQIDAVSLVAGQLQRMWSKHGGSELLPSSWDGENLQVIFLGGGGCGKTHTPF